MDFSHLVQLRQALNEQVELTNTVIGEAKRVETETDELIRLAEIRSASLEKSEQIQIADVTQVREIEKSYAEDEAAWSTGILKFGEMVSDCDFGMELPSILAKLRKRDIDDRLLRHELARQKLKSLAKLNELERALAALQESTRFERQRRQEAIFLLDGLLNSEILRLSTNRADTRGTIDHSNSQPPLNEQAPTSPNLNNHNRIMRFRRK